MYRSTFQITWCDQLTSPGLQRTARALFIQMERADAPKGIDIIRKTHPQRPFDVQMSHEQPRILDVTHKNTPPNKTRLCKLMLTICLLADTFFSNIQLKLCRSFPELVSAAEIYCLFKFFAASHQNSNSCASDYKTKQVISY